MLNFTDCPIPGKADNQSSKGTRESDDESTGSFDMGAPAIEKKQEFIFGASPVRPKLPEFVFGASPAGQKQEQKFVFGAPPVPQKAQSRRTDNAGSSGE